MALNTAKNPSRELNWLDLPNHVLLLITDKLITQIKDYIRFGAVCRSWRSVYTHNLHWYRTHLPRQLPLLMLSTKDDVNHSILYSLTENKICNFPFAVPHNQICCGSTQGWLVTVYNTKVRLLNPWLTVNNEIELPSIAAIHRRPNEIRVEKVGLSANPTLNSSYIVMAIYDGHNYLAFFKPGEKNWRSFDDGYAYFEDVIYYKDQFYAINLFGAVYICDVDTSQPRLSKFIERTSAYPSAEKRYLVESNGGLLQILLQCGEKKVESTTFYFTDRFEVLRLDPVKLEWIETKNLSGRMLFLGRNSSMSLLASDFPGCKPNSIYFTDDYFGRYYIKLEEPYDMGVFNIEDGSFETHYPNQVPPKLFLPPIWILPTL